jgi:class 3 adenylate cyclase
MERRLAAILAADVVGYSRLMEQDEADTFERLRAHRTELFGPEIEKHHGRIFKLMGDGLLAEFGSVVDAVECAVILQRGMAERNSGVAEGRRIDVRIGVNLGDVIVEADDRHGDGVNIAARLQQLAKPGSIYVSGKVAKEVGRRLPLGFEQMGEQKMKNLAEPVEVYRVVAAGSLAPTKSGAGRRAHASTGAVVAAAALLVVNIAHHHIENEATHQHQHKVAYVRPTGELKKSFPLCIEQHHGALAHDHNPDNQVPDNRPHQSALIDIGPSPAVDHFVNAIEQ